MSSPSPSPAEPVTDGAAHHQLEITPAEPRQLFGEQHHALEHGMRVMSVPQNMRAGPKAS